MHHVAASMARAELAQGVEARLVDPFDPAQQGWDLTLDADIHVSHTNIPERIGAHVFQQSCTKPYRWVFPIHGTPEHVFESSIQDASTNGYNTGVSYAQHQWGMQNADAIMTFVPRHQWLYQIGTDKHTIVDLIPMGIDTHFWTGGASPGKYAGLPSFFSCENQHAFKWGIYLMRMWSRVREGLPSAVLHVANLPTNIQRFADMLVARYGARGVVAGSWRYDHPQLRDIMRSMDFYVSPVRYGDVNRACLEASAAGLRVISYPGNDYADYWMHEGDDRLTARDLIEIGKGEIAPRSKTPVPTEADMARAAINVYERVLDRPRTNWALGGIPDPIPENIANAIATVCGLRTPVAPPPLVQVVEAPQPISAPATVTVATPTPTLHLVVDEPEPVAEATA